MRADICKGVDLRTLDKAIFEFERDNNCECETLVMSKDTRTSVFSAAIGHYNIGNDQKKNRYKGREIIIDDSFRYGKVEII